MNDYWGEMVVFISPDSPTLVSARIEDLMISLTPDHARELAKSFLRAADTAEEGYTSEQIKQMASLDDKGRLS